MQNAYYIYIYFLNIDKRIYIGEIYSVINNYYIQYLYQKPKNILLPGTEIYINNYG